MPKGVPNKRYTPDFKKMVVDEKGIRRSMSRKGNWLDNAVIEDFFGLLKCEHIITMSINFQTPKSSTSETVYKFLI